MAVRREGRFPILVTFLSCSCHGVCVCVCACVCVYGSHESMSVHRDYLKELALECPRKKSPVELNVRNTSLPHTYILSHIHKLVCKRKVLKSKCYAFKVGIRKEVINCSFPCLKQLEMSGIRWAEGPEDEQQAMEPRQGAFL